MTQPFVARYRNWRGEVSERRLIPQLVRFGSTDWHPEPQWLLLAFDLDKQAPREFALKDFNPPEAEDTADPMTSLRSAIAGLERVGVDTSELAESNVVAEWPVGCIKRSACARHKACVYGNFGSCTHATRSIAAEVEKASEGGR